MSGILAGAIVAALLSEPLSTTEAVLKLHKCAEANDAACIKALVQSGVGVDTLHNGAAPLAAAAKAGAAEATRQLIASGADIQSASGQSALRNAVWQGKEDIVRILLAAGANPDPPHLSHSPLYQACIGGPTSMVPLLISAGANIESKDSLGRTPLLAAACNGAFEKVKILLAAGAVVEVHDQRGTSPLLCAATKSRPTVSILVEAGADVNWVDDSGNCAWSEASELETRFQKSFGVLEILRAAGARPCK